MARLQKKHISDRKLLERQFFRFLPLQVLLLVITALNGVISGFYGSNFVSMEAMTAIGLFMPISIFITAAGNMFMSGSQILAGKLIGENHLLRSRRIFIADLIATGVFSVALSALLLLLVFTGQTKLFTSRPAEAATVGLYIIGQAVGIPPLMLGQQLSALQSMENHQHLPEAAGIAYVLTNFLFCEVLVRHLRKGVLALSLASAFGAMVFFLILAWFYVTGKSDILNIRNLQNRSMDKETLPRFAAVKEIFAIVRTGLPGALHNIFEMLRTMAVNALIMKYVPAVGLSSLTAVNSVMRIFWCLPFGMIAVSRILIGISIGENHRKDLTDVMWIAIFRCIPIVTAVSVILILLADPLTGLFFRDPTQEVYRLTCMGLRLLPICMPFAVFSHHFACFAQASRQHFLEYAIPFLAGFAFVSLFSAILIPPSGMTGMYIANILNSSLCCLIVLLYSMVKRRHFPKNMEELMVLDDSFGVREEERIDITVRSMEDVIKVSETAHDFCKERGIDSRRAFFCSLFLEEMAGNVVIHGFREGKEPHYVEIRIIHKEDDIILRIRDNCTPFNPKAFTDMLFPEDPFACIGIRLVLRLAKDAQYQSMLGLNVLTMCLPERSQSRFTKVQHNS